jgi:hypothetical protein
MTYSVCYEFWRQSPSKGKKKTTLGAGVRAGLRPPELLDSAVIRRNFHSHASATFVSVGTWQITPVAARSS